MVTVMKSAIEEELLAVLGKKFKVKESESKQTYLARVIRGIDKLKDEDWKVLSEEAQDWLNKGIQAIEESEEIADFPDWEASEAKEETGKKTKSKRKKKVKKKVSKKRVPASHAMRLIILKNLKIGKEAAIEELQNQGHELKRNPATLIYYDVRATVKALRELKMLKE
jgi:hypothetical protein